MTVYGPRLYFGASDTPPGASPDSSYSSDIIREPSPEQEYPVTDLVWTRPTPGRHVAELDGTTGVLRWMVVRTAARRWEVISITTGWERRRHGASYTLREAKEIVGHFHADDLRLATA